MLRQSVPTLKHQAHRWDRPAGACAVICALMAIPEAALAYIGPGAGFALGGSFVFALIGLLLALGALFMWPVRTLVRVLRSRGRLRKARAKRVVVLGLDGMDPGLTQRMIQQGELPSFARLQQQGAFSPLATTLPAVSPVAWSGFATGADASRHNIFDFLSRDLRTYLPILSSTRFSSKGMTRRIGRWVISRGKAEIQSLRRSKTFWRILSENGVRSTVLRLPITFPPEKFDGLMLSAMCVPDLRGTQGTFSFYTTAPGGEGETKGGERMRLDVNGSGTFHSHLIGPDLGETDRSGPMTLPLRVQVDSQARRASFAVDGQQFTLGEAEFSPWIPLVFKAGRIKARGICKLRVTSWQDPFSFYVTPINIDPEHPAMPISHPAHYAIALAKLHGPYATLGLAEDTWALNERVIDEQTFLDQAWATHEEREKQFFHALDRQKQGVVATVFDATDRIQHMFFRYLDPDHPANRGRDTERHKDAIANLYRRADNLLERTMAKLDEKDVLLVVSDHGFKTFQRCVNLNSWFRANGYLYLTDDPATGPLPRLPAAHVAEPQQIDWSRTRAYTNGLTGFYLNIAGREQRGVVSAAQAPILKQEIMTKLRALQDEERNTRAISEVWDSLDVYRGPYGANAPDVVVGYEIGYRADWDAAVGRVTGQTISDNTRGWSGDHCMDPRKVPGILFTNIPFQKRDPGLIDLAPSILDLFGIAAPAYMTGRTIFEEK